MTTRPQFGPDLVQQLADIARRYPVDVPTVLRLASEVEEVIRVDERAKVAEEIPGWAHEQTITTDGGSYWLDCDWCNRPVMPVDPGDSLETLFTSARDHRRACIARQHTTGEDTDPR